MEEVLFRTMAYYPLHLVDLGYDIISSHHGVSWREHGDPVAFANYVDVYVLDLGHGYGLYGSEWEDGKQYCVFFFSVLIGVFVFWYLCQGYLLYGIYVVEKKKHVQGRFCVIETLVLNRVCLILGFICTFCWNHFGCWLYSR